MEKTVRYTASAKHHALTDMWQGYIICKKEEYGLSTRQELPVGELVETEDKALNIAAGIMNNGEF